MLNDEIIKQMAKEFVESLRDVDDFSKVTLLDWAEDIIQAQRKLQVLNQLQQLAIAKLASYTLKKEVTELDKSVVEFLNDDSTVVVNKPVGEVYSDYVAFCQTNSLKPMTKIIFSKEVQKSADIVSTTTSKNGRSIRVFRAK